jgi:hypothetical protein
MEIRNDECERSFNWPYVQTVAKLTSSSTKSTLHVCRRHDIHLGELYTRLYESHELYGAS